MILCDRKWPFSSCSIGRRYDSFRSLFLPVCQFTVSEELVKTILKLLHYPFTNNQAIFFCSVSLILVCVTLRDHGIVWQSWKREERGECLISKYLKSLRYLISSVFTPWVSSNGEIQDRKRSDKVKVLL